MAPGEVWAPAVASRRRRRSARPARKGPAARPQTRPNPAAADARRLHAQVMGRRWRIWRRTVAGPSQCVHRGRPCVDFIHRVQRRGPPLRPAYENEPRGPPAARRRPRSYAARMRSAGLASGRRAARGPIRHVYENNEDRPRQVADPPVSYVGGMARRFSYAGGMARRFLTSWEVWRSAFLTWEVWRLDRTGPRARCRAASARLPGRAGCRRSCARGGGRGHATTCSPRTTPG